MFFGQKGPFSIHLNYIPFVIGHLPFARAALYLGLERTIQEYKNCLR